MSASDTSGRRSATTRRAKCSAKLSAAFKLVQDQLKVKSRRWPVAKPSDQREASPFGNFLGSVDVFVERPHLADSVEKVGHGFHGRKVRA